MCRGYCRGDHRSPGTQVLQICIGFRQIRNISLRGRSLSAPTPSIAPPSKSVILSEHMASRRIFAPNICEKVSEVRRFFDFAHSASLRMTPSLLQFKFQFIALMPSPLGRVAEHSEVGRGAVKCCVLPAFTRSSHCLHASSVMPYGMPPSPEGKAYLPDKLQFIALFSQSSPPGRKKRKGSKACGG